MSTESTGVKINIGLQVLILALVVSSLSIHSYFTFKSRTHSVTGVDMGKYGGWQSYTEFDKKCKDGLNEYEDLKDDCTEVSTFKFVGTTYVVLASIGLIMQAINLAGLISLMKGLRLGFAEIGLFHYL
jgi:hypothetical protein